MHRITGAMSAGEMYVHAVADNINSGFLDVNDGIEGGTGMVKEAVFHQLEAVSDATTSLGTNFQKSIKSYKREAGRFARSLGEIVDVEDILKSFHKVTNPEDGEDRKSSIIHTPIDWSKNPPSHRKKSEECSSSIEGEEGDDDVTAESKGNIDAPAEGSSCNDRKKSQKDQHKPSFLTIKSKNNAPSNSPRMYRKQLMR